MGAKTPKAESIKEMFPKKETKQEKQSLKLGGKAKIPQEALDSIGNALDKSQHEAAKRAFDKSYIEQQKNRLLSA